MTTTDFTLTLTTERTPQEVFKSVTKVRDWWTGFYSEEIEGSTEKPGDEFVFRAGPGLHYSRQKLVEVIPGKKLVWLVTDSELTFLEDKQEWTGTRLIFDITGKGGITELVFTHEGLNPDIECFDACAPAWAQYLRNKLLPLINTGEVQ